VSVTRGASTTTITDKQIREYRSTLFGAAYDYDAWLTCQIALGNRLPYDGMSREQARAWVERAMNGDSP